jgi:hypothetical protein
MATSRLSFTAFHELAKFDRGPRCSDAWAVRHRRLLALALWLGSLLVPVHARAGQPEPEAFLKLDVPSLAALPPSPATFFAPTILAKRARDRTFDTSMGERDPRVKNRPRTHRFRLALASHWVRLSQTQNTNTGEFVRFHYAPLYLDLAYQAQFLKYVMVRLAVGIGYNVANSRNSMPLSIFPQAYLGYQGKSVGVAFGYGFDWTIPPVFDATANESNALQQPVITRNHVVMGELSYTTRVDRVALTFSFSIGGIQSDLSHYDTYNRKWRPYIGFGFGAFFDGTIRREKKALEKANLEGR